MRFPEFSENWYKKVFFEIADFYKGCGISKNQLSENGNECILYGELYTTYKTETINKIKSKTNINTSGLFFGKKNDVIIPASGETPIDIVTACCLNKDNILFGGDLNIIRLKSDNGSFISYQLNGKRKIDIAKMAQGASIVHLHNDDLKKLTIYLPISIKEQNKIVHLFYLIDSRIETQSKIIEDLEILEKWIINHHFCNNPNMNLGEIIEQICERNKINNVNRVLSVSNKYGFINQSEQFEDREIASDDRTNYKIVRKNNFAFNPARINVGSIAKLDNYDIGIVSPMYICFKCNTYIIDVDYLSYYFLSNAFKNELYKRLEGSVRQCLQYDALCNIKLYVSSPTKQIDFVAKIKALTKKLQTEKDILLLYKKQKAYLLQNMFI